MRRYTIQPRENWEATVESQGFHFHSVDDEPYWDESVYYLFTADEIDAIERATYALDEMCLKAVEHVIEQNLFDRFQDPARVRRLRQAKLGSRRVDDLWPIRSCV